MKRFFCTVCKKVRRVRILPRSIPTISLRNNSLPQDRIGVCDKHDGRKR